MAGEAPRAAEPSSTRGGAVTFRTAVLSSLILLVAGILGGVFVGVVTVVDRAARAGVEADLSRARALFADLWGYRASLFRSQAQVVAEEPRIKAVVAAEDASPETVRDVVRDMFAVLGSDLFYVTNARGVVLADAQGRVRAGEDRSRDPLVEGALARGESATISVEDGAGYQMYAQRIALGAAPEGVLVLGHRVDDRFAQAVARQTASAVVVLLADRVIAASPFDGAEVDRARLAAALGDLGDAGARPAEVSVEGARYLAIAAPFPSEGGTARDPGGAPRMRYVVLRSLDRALAPGRRLEAVLVGILGLGTGAAVLLALGLSRRLSRPLDDLVAFTRALAKGSLEARAEVAGPVEVRTLAAAMNRMAGELAASRRVLLDRQRLEREMEIAARIQSAILPPVTRARGWEIAARMIPATEVGGDYYDVIDSEEGCFVGIGDVAGHGLTAGLVMMMVQSVVSGLVRQRPDASPAEIVRVLNVVLFDNVRNRLRQDEHVTFTLLRLTPDGRATFAGAHEDMILCRAAGAPELVRSAGTWLGAVPDVGRATVDTSTDLRPGDRLVLFTDGLTEATSAGGEMFGVERLMAAVEASRGDAPDRMVDGILDAVRAWAPEQADDRTIVVLAFTGAP